MVKPRSKTVGKKTVTKKQASVLADQLSDKPYGGVSDDKEYKQLTISMAEGTFYGLDDLSRSRKRGNIEPKSMSAIANITIEEYLRKHKKIINIYELCFMNYCFS